MTKQGIALLREIDSLITKVSDNQYLPKDAKDLICDRLIECMGILDCIDGGKPD